jgi:nitrite reductase (NO-forming)
MDGEFSGIHNVLVRTGPERFFSPMLAHAESFSHTIMEEGEYDYFCTPHPYMEGKVIVMAENTIRNVQYSASGSAPTGRMVWVILIIAGFALMIAIISLINK